MKRTRRLSSSTSHDGPGDPHGHLPPRRLPSKRLRKASPEALQPSSPLTQPSDLDAEGDPDPDYLHVSVKDEEAVSEAVEVAAQDSGHSARGVESSISRQEENEHSHLVKAKYLKMDTQITPSTAAEAPGTNVETSDVSSPLATGTPTGSSVAVGQEVSSELKKKIFASYRSSMRANFRNLEVKEAEKSWAASREKTLGNCLKCKSGCVLESGRAICTHCVTLHARCSHRDTFRYERVAELTGTTPEIVKGVVESDEAMHKRSSGASKKTRSSESRRKLEQARTDAKDAPPKGTKSKGISRRQITTGPSSSSVSTEFTAEGSTSDLSLGVINAIEGPPPVAKPEDDHVDLDMNSTFPECSLQQYQPSVLWSTSNDMITASSEDTGEDKSPTASIAVAGEDVPSHSGQPARVDSQAPTDMEVDEGPGTLDMSSAIQEVPSPTTVTMLGVEIPLSNAHNNSMVLGDAGDRVDAGSRSEPSIEGVTDASTLDLIPGLFDMQMQTPPVYIADRNKVFPLFTSPTSSFPAPSSTQAYTASFTYTNADVNFQASFPVQSASATDETIHSLDTCPSESVNAQQITESMLIPNHIAVQQDEVMESGPASALKNETIPSLPSTSTVSDHVADQQDEFMSNIDALQAWFYIVKAESAIQNGQPQEAREYLQDAMGHCDALIPFDEVD